MDPALREKLALLVIGWLMGLLAPAIVDAIKRRRDNARGREAILSELREVGTTLSLAAYGVRTDEGRVSREFLEWLKSDFEHYAITTEFQHVVPAIRNLLALNDDQLLAVNREFAAKPAVGSVLQHVAAPLLDSRVSALWSFDTDFQRRLLEIKHNLALLDDLVDRSRLYFDLTFTVKGPNHQLVCENFKLACAKYGERAERVVRLIRTLSSAEAR